MTPEERRTRWREAKRRQRARNRKPRQLEPCGTVGALRRHERAKETLDPACQRVRDERNAANYQRRARQRRKG